MQGNRNGRLEVIIWFAFEHVTSVHAIIAEPVSGSPDLFTSAFAHVYAVWNHGIVTARVQLYVTLDCCINVIQCQHITVEPAHIPELLVFLKHDTCESLHYLSAHPQLVRPLTAAGTGAERGGPLEQGGAAVPPSHDGEVLIRLPPHHVLQQRVTGGRTRLKVVWRIAAMRMRMWEQGQEQQPQWILPQQGAVHSVPGSGTRHRQMCMIPPCSSHEDIYQISA